MMFLCLLCAVVGLALFGLSDPNHHGRRLGSALRPDRQRRLRVAGWVAVVACLPLAIAARGAVFGPVWWLAALMLAAGVVWLGLNLLPHSRKPSQERR